MEEEKFDKEQGGSDTPPPSESSNYTVVFEENDSMHPHNQSLFTK